MKVVLVLLATLEVEKCTAIIDLTIVFELLKKYFSTQTSYKFIVPQTS